MADELTVVDVQKNILAATNALAAGVVFGVQGAQRAASENPQQAGNYVSVA
jgi:hypothetical protein